MGSNFVTSQEPNNNATAGTLSIALIGPDEMRRRAAMRALAGPQAGYINEIDTYPQMEDLPRLMDRNPDVVLIDIDCDPEFALRLIEAICSVGQATVMTYSAKVDADMMLRCMRAGAREYLHHPFSGSTMAEALVRAIVRRPAQRVVTETAEGKLLVFIGAKGGSGVTTLATNFAVSLGQESNKKTLLIDMDLPLGDAALGLGIASEYSTADALDNAARLDSNFLSRLLVKHSSGISVLPAPGKLRQVQLNAEAINKLISVAKQNFDYVVVDAASHLNMAGSAMFDEAETIYLVTQVGIPDLRNSNRLISEYFAASGQKLEVVINRYSPRTLGIDEDAITRALTKPAKWKVPGDYATARRTQDSATPLVLEDSPVSRAIRQMAKAACGLVAGKEKKKKFLFGL
jgi:pilus assembly protein CpaE